MHKCSNCGELLKTLSMACPLCGMMSSVTREDFGFSTAFDAVTYVQEEFALITSVRVPTLFILLSRPSKYALIVKRCSDLEEKIRLAFSMYASDPTVADILQDVYNRTHTLRRLMERKFSEMDLLFKGSLAMLVLLFGLLSSLYEKILVSFGYTVEADRLHRIADAMNHTAISFIFVGVLIYMAASAYNAKKRFYG